MSNNELVKRYSRPPVGGQATKPGEVEAWGLMTAALRIKESRERNQDDEIMLAVRLNWRLWTIFQADLLDPDCTVSADIRMNLLSLANFIDQHTVAFIAEPKPEKLDVLISINRELAGGLYDGPVVANETGSEAAGPGPATVVAETPPVAHPAESGSEGDRDEIHYVKVSV